MHIPWTKMDKKEPIPDPESESEQIVSMKVVVEDMIKQQNLED